MGAGESSWSHWTSTSVVEERGEIGIFGNKIFLKKKEEGCGDTTRRRAYPARRQVGLTVLFIFLIFNFLKFI